MKKSANNHTQQEPGTTGLFFALIRCGIGKEEKLPVSPTATQWAVLFEMARKQTLAGIAFAGIEKLPNEQRPPKHILLQWYSLCESIKSKNTELNRKSSLVSQKFKAEGFDNCILKGQGIAQLYPNPALRTPGDIDIWLAGGSKRILQYVRKFTPNEKPVYHHIDFPIAPGLDIEVHFTPSWMYSPFKNRKLQQFFSKNAAQQFSNIIKAGEYSIPAPTPAFNRIYILLHIYRHLFFEGIGIRQLLDYYFVIKQEITEDEKIEHIRLLKEFGLYKFATAATYAMQQMFMLEDEFTYITPNKKEGEFLIHEIMTAGNFGQYDTRYKSTQRGLNLARFYDFIKRSAILITHYHFETLWNPYFKTWHTLWRWRNR